MAAIRAKWHNPHGATMMMALLMLLVATVVSVIVVTSATTAMRRIQSDHAQQQSWLTVSSAAQMLRDGIKDDFFLLTTTKTTIGGKTEITESREAVTGDFADLLEPALQYLDANSAKDHYETTFTVSTGELDPVTVHFFLFRDTDGGQSSDYTIKAFFYLPDTEYDCRMTLEIGSSEVEQNFGSTEDSHTGKIVSVTEKTITWGTGTITRGAAE